MWKTLVFLSIGLLVMTAAVLQVWSGGLSFGVGLVMVQTMCFAVLMALPTIHRFGQAGPSRSRFQPIG